jgi:F-type H+-transporting ATPase subunit delta
LTSDVAAKRYAEAAYEIAREAAATDAWDEGLHALAALYGDEQAAAFIGNSRVPLQQKQELVRKALGGVPEGALNLALLLLQRSRTALGPAIADAYRQMLDEARGVAHATVTTAVAMSDSELADVRKKLTEITGGEVVVNTQVDEGILGGIIVRIGDRLIDGSTRNRLLALRSAIGGRAGAGS